MTFFFTVSDNLHKEKQIKISKFGTFSIRKKNQELEETQRLKKSKRYQKEMLFCLNPQKNLKNLLI